MSKKFPQFTILKPDSIILFDKKITGSIVTQYIRNNKPNIYLMLCKIFLIHLI